jgi:hypothetical protein
MATLPVYLVIRFILKKKLEKISKMDDSTKENKLGEPELPNS